MARLNKALVGELQETVFSDQIKEVKGSLDLNYRGFNRGNPKDFLVKTNYLATVNRVLFWLTSKPNDYIRQSYKGGLLYSMLGSKAADIDVQKWETEIRNKFNQDFSQDLTLTLLKLDVDNFRKVLTIQMIVQDNITKAMTPITTGVTL